MIEAEALVIKTEGKVAFVKTESPSGCSICAGKGCGISFIGRLLGKANSIYRVNNSIEAHVGDRILIGVQDGIILNASLVIYFIPIVAVLLGAVIGSSLGEGSAADKFALLGAGFGFLLGIVFIKTIWRTTGPEKFQPIALKNLSQNLTCIK